MHGCGFQLKQKSTKKQREFDIRITASYSLLLFLLLRKMSPPEVHAKTCFVIIGFGSSFGNGKTLPRGTFATILPISHNLTDVVGVVHHLSVSGLLPAVWRWLRIKIISIKILILRRHSGH